MKTKDLFNRIADNYDLMNRLISLGLDKGWREKAIEILQPASNGSYLDIGAGTADLGINIVGQTPTTTVVSLDPAIKMLKLGSEKITALNLTKDRLPIVCGNGLSLPFRDSTFDGVISAFCIRNIDDRMMIAEEIRRVIKPGGRFVILDLWKPESTILAGLCRIYNSTVLPLTGAILSEKEAYQYLAQSIEKFPPAKEIATLFEEQGFENVRVESLSWGIVSIVHGVRD